MTMENWNVLRDIPMQELVLHIPDDKSNSHIDVTPEYIELLETVIHAEQDGVPLVTGYSVYKSDSDSVILKKCNKTIPCRLQNNFITRNGVNHVINLVGSDGLSAVGKAHCGNSAVLHKL